MGRRAGSFSKLRGKKTEVGIKTWLSFQSGNWVVGRMILASYEGMSSGDTPRKTRLSVPWFLQGPWAARCCVTQKPVSNHLSRALVQDGSFAILPSSVWCPREPSSCQTCRPPGFQFSCQLPACVEPGKFVTVLHS